MAICKLCGKPFAWGNADGKWVPLIPVGEEGEHDRDYQDEHGVLRTGYRTICAMAGGPTVRVSKLAKAVAVEEILPPRRKRKPKDEQSDGAPIMNDVRPS